MRPAVTSLTGLMQFAAGQLLTKDGRCGRTRPQAHTQLLQAFGTGSRQASAVVVMAAAVSAAAAAAVVASCTGAWQHCTSGSWHVQHILLLHLQSHGGSAAHILAGSAAAIACAAAGRQEHLCVLPTLFLAAVWC